MDTNATIHQLLTKGEMRFEAAKLAAEGNVHTFMGNLKALYEKWHGRVGIDNNDWHWQATALKNHLKEHGDPKPVKDAAPTKDDTTLKHKNLGSDPHTSGMGEGVTKQGVDEPVGTAAPGTPTSMGTPLGLATPSTKPKPDANDPTDASLIKTQPVVTDPVHGGVTETPGSPAAQEPALKSHDLKKK